jgi:hypothetical protein
LRNDEQEDGMRKMMSASWAIVLATTAALAQNTETAQPPGRGMAPAPTHPSAPQAAPMTGSSGSEARETDANAGLIPGAPIGSTRQTVPAKISPENAALDEQAIMAHPLALTDAQRQRIFEAVAAEKDEVVRNISVAPATVLPADVMLQEFPPGLAGEIPTIRGLKYVRLPEKIALVRPANRIIVGEISR